MNLPADRTADCTVEIVVNGTILCKETVTPSETDKTVSYKGDIVTISVTVDGQAYQDYDIVEPRS